MAKKKLSKKKQKELKIKILVFVLVCLISLGSFLFIKLTTPPQLEKVIDGIMFNTSEVELDIVVSNKNEEVKYKFIVSDSNNYIKIEKEANETKETSIVYKEHDIYYLYVDKEVQTTIELQGNDGINMINTLKKEVYDLESYLDIDYKSVKYYYYSEELVTFSNYNNNIFYDNEMVIKDDKLVSLTKVFGVNNVVNTVKIDVNYEINIEFPTNKL